MDGTGDAWTPSMHDVDGMDFVFIRPAHDP